MNAKKIKENIKNKQNVSDLKNLKKIGKKNKQLAKSDKENYWA